MMRRSIYIIGIGVAGLLAACSSDDPQLGTVTASETITVTATVGLPQPADTRLVLTNDYTAQGGNTLTAVWSSENEGFTVWKKDATAEDDSSVKTYPFGDCKPYADAHYAKFTGKLTDPEENKTYYAIYPATTPVKANNIVTLNVKDQTGKLNDNDKVYMYTSGQYNEKGASLELQEFKYLTAIIKVRLKFKTETEVGAEDYKYGGDITTRNDESNKIGKTISDVTFKGTGLLSQATVSLDNPTSYTKVDGAAEEISFGNQSFQLEKNYNEDGTAGNGVTTVSATVYLHVIPDEIKDLTVYATKDGRTYKHTWTQTFNLTAGYFYYDNDDDNVSEPAWTVELVEEEPTTPAEESTLGMVDARATAEITQTRLYFGGETTGEDSKTWKQVLWNRSGEELTVFSVDNQNTVQSKNAFTEEVSATSSEEHQEKATFIGYVKGGDYDYYAFYPVINSVVKDFTKVPLDLTGQVGTIEKYGTDAEGNQTVIPNDINKTFMYAKGESKTHEDNSVELGLKFEHLTAIIELTMQFTKDAAETALGDHDNVYVRYVTFTDDKLLSNATVDVSNTDTGPSYSGNKAELVLGDIFMLISKDAKTTDTDGNAYSYSTKVYLHVFPATYSNLKVTVCMDYDDKMYEGTVLTNTEIQAGKLYKKTIQMTKTATDVPDEKKDWKKNEGSNE